MGTDRKQLFLHIGHGKTGTSAIQAVLARSSEPLRAHGVEYPYHPSFGAAKAGKVTSGNVNANTDWVAQIRRGMSAATCPKVLFSNESLFHAMARQKDFNEFLPLTEEYDVSIIMFVRNPVDMLLSTYGQAIKRGGSTEDLETFWPREAHLKKASGLLDQFKAKGMNVVVRNYSHHKTGSIDEFMRILLDGKDPDFDTSVGIVNRSLSNAELVLQKTFNAYYGQGSAKFISDVLVNEMPNIPSEAPYFAPADFEAFSDGMKEAVANINTALPASEPLFLQDYESYHFPTDDREVTMKRGQIEVIAKSLSTRLKEIEDYIDGLEDFDPRRYKELNPDISQSGLAPLQHFVKFGIKARRRYK